MHLVRHNPFSELQKMERDVDSFWNNDWNFPTLLADNSAIDMYEEEGQLVTEMHLPKFKKEEITINYEGNVVEVSAKHEDKEEKNIKRRYLMRESSNTYYRRIVLPEGANGTQANAEYHDGTLKITMPMTPPKEPTMIEIK